MILMDQKVLAWQISCPVQGQLRVLHGNGCVLEHHSQSCKHRQLSPPTKKKFSLSLNAH